MFKDMKTSGYNLEKTKVSDTRFFALLRFIMMAYTLATLYGQRLKEIGMDRYCARSQEYLDKTPHTSTFTG